MAGVCSITAGSTAIFRDRPAFAGHRNLFLIQRFSIGDFWGRRARKQVARRSIGHRQTFDRYSGGNPTILDHVWLLNSNGGRQSCAATAQGSFDTQTTPSHNLTELVQCRACLERTPFWCRAALGGLYGLRPGSSRQLRNLPQTPWQLLGLRGNPGIYLAVMGLLECCHLHPVTSTHIGGCRQDVGRSLPGWRPGVGRASTDLLIINRYSDGARPYVERALPDSH